MIRATDNLAFALYDTTTGQTIGGPLFASAEHADDFVEWAGDRLTGPSPTNYPTAQALVDLQREWERARLDEDGELRGEMQRCPTHGEYAGDVDTECPACERAIAAAEWERV